MHTEIFAVIWVDFIPLSLKYASAAAAIAAAKAMHDNAHQNRVAIRELRDVRLDEADKLHTLWKPEV